MAKPDYADELIANSPSLQKMMASKKALADKLRVLYPTEGLSSFSTYADLIKNIPYNIDYVFGQLGLTCQEEFKNIIQESYDLYTDESVVYTSKKYQNSNIIYAPTREVGMDASYCFAGSNLKYCEPLTIPAGANITQMFDSDLEHLELTVDDSKVFSCVGPYIQSDTLKEVKINGVFNCSANNYSACIKCKKLEYADVTFVNDLTLNKSSYWMFNHYIYSNEAPVEGIKFRGKQKGAYRSDTNSYDRFFFLPYTTADILINYARNHIVDFTLDENKPILSKYSDNITGSYRVGNIMRLLNVNTQVLQDAGRYSEFEDLLNERGWVSYKQWKEGNPLSIE